MTRTDDRQIVLVADSDFGELEIEEAIVEGAGLQLVSAQCKSEDDVIRVGRNADGVLTQYAPIGARAIEAFTRCRVIARYGTGVDIVDVDAATRRGIQVTNAPNDWCAGEVADHAIALWLAAVRKIAVYDAATHRGEWRWQRGQPIGRIQGRVFGLLSFGAIAREIAARARPFGVEIWAHDPYVDDVLMEEFDVRTVSLDDLVEGSDYLMIQSPLTAQTRRMFDRRRFRQMKRTAILVNTARGPIVEDAALFDALSLGWIAGAAVDDLEEEPAKVREWKAVNPLFEVPNLLITPHASYYSEESMGTVRRIAAEEVVRTLRGLPPRSPVNDVGLSLGTGLEA